MIKKYLKIGFLIALALLVLVPSFLYIKAVDWSNSHSARVASLPLFDGAVDEGEYRLKANNFEFLIRVAGMQNEGPGIVLLHGFPETSLVWKPLLEKAASEGYRVLAFDQRGYSPNARPKGVEHYHIDSLVQDVLAVADQVAFDTFHLVGHDWGSGVGWKTVMDYPERIHTWTAMAIPHVGVFFEAILNHPEQQKRSAYIKTFQIPILPELLFALTREKNADKLKGVWRDEEIKESFAIQGEHGALTASLNWYRGLDLSKKNAVEFLKKEVHRPTLFIWGKEDHVIAPEVFPLQIPYIKAPFEELSLETGHALMQIKTDSVVQAILRHVEK